MIKAIMNIIYIVTASYDLGSVPDPEEMDAQLKSIADREPDARGVAVATHQRDLSWDCGSKEAARILSDTLQQLPNVTVETTEIED